MTMTTETVEKLLPKISNYEDLESLFRQPLDAVHGLVTRIPGEFAIPILGELCRRLETDTASFRRSDPDVFHNLAIVSGRLGRHDLKFKLLTIGITLFEDVDLLADLLQVYYSQQMDRESAAAVWTKLEAIDRSVRSRYWRYWVFGAIYHMRLLQNIDSAKELLVQGLKVVRGDQKCDVLRSYDDVFIDGSSNPDTATVINAWKNAIQQGYELSYTIALRLAILQQRQAGSALTQREDRHRLLEEALSWLDVAEATFTADRRHPITDIYRVRVNILIGLQRHVEAIEYITAIFAHTPDADRFDPSLKPQFILACHRAGKPDAWKLVVADTARKAQSPEGEEP